MNIKRAKEEIKHAVAAYLEKDENGDYRIPDIRQRPILLMGPPGIGKTQIMEQIAGECDLALVSYTITHHTRQSAIGLPFIREKTYGGQVRSVTEYTMSEIIASVYDRMEQSGKKEGLLFIDEINCVSETLAPAMLQFLQGKSFGNQKVPEGWIIVAAGNPAEYNRSVREFDVVTLDRVKLVDVEADYGVWKEYAYQVGIHESIIAYLDIHRENFYRMESSVDGRQFVTARGWEDLSELIYAYERLGLKADREVVCQYLHHPVVAKDYANYLSLYYRYRTDYQVDEILQGVIRPGTLNKLKFAPFDERIQVVSLLLARLSDTFRETFDQDEDVKALYALVTEFLEDEKSADKEKLAQLFAREEEAREKRMAAGQNAKQLRRRGRYMEDMARRMMDALSAPQTDALSASQTDAMSASQTDALNASRMDARTAIRPVFMQESEKREEMAAKAMQQLEYAFDFMEKAFGQSQEMVVFITELSINRYAAWFLKENDCPRYYQYNKNLLFDDRQVQTLARIDSLKKQRIAEDLTLTEPEESDPESE